MKTLYWVLIAVVVFIYLKKNRSHFGANTPAPITIINNGKSKPGDLPWEVLISLSPIGTKGSKTMVLTNPEQPPYSRNTIKIPDVFTGTTLSYPFTFYLQGLRGASFKITLNNSKNIPVKIVCGHNPGDLSHTLQVNNLPVIKLDANGTTLTDLKIVPPITVS